MSDDTGAAPVEVVSPYADADDRQVEQALRPRCLADFVGQQRVRE
jgi:holliday junction DNA helicase RuvB